MKQKLVALFLIIVMVASTLTAVGLATTTTVAAATTTQIVLIPSVAYNQPVGQPVTFTATLTLKSSTTALSGKSVTIYHYLNGVRYTDTTKTTNANGQITLTQSFGSAGERMYFAVFRGDSSSAPSTSNYGRIWVMLTTTLSPNSAVTGSANVGQKFSLNGFLKDQNSKGVAGQKIQFYWFDSTSASWKPGDVVYTDSSGYYQHDVFSDQLATMRYQAKYAGDSTHLAVSSKIWTVTWKFQPQLSLQVSKSSLAVGGTVFFSGYLKDQTGFRPGEPLWGKTITLYWRNDPSSGWNKGPTTTTDQYGYYFFGTSSDHSQTVYYYVSYNAAQQIPPDYNTYWNVDSSQVTVTWT